MADDARIETEIPNMEKTFHDPLIQECGHGLTGPGGALYRYAQRPKGYQLGEDDFDHKSWQLLRQPNYTDAEHKRWDILYANQKKIIQGRACSDFIKGFKKLESCFGHGIPSFDDINAILEPATGWQVIAVPELIPDNVFFWHLENRRFPAGVFIRGGQPQTTKVIEANQGREPEFVEYTQVEDDLYYLQEPDIFHDVFGHVPMLMDPHFADYIQAYGAGGRRAIQYNRTKNFGAIYWYTVEFGLIQEDDGLRIYGAGILSSPDETLFALHSNSPHRIKMVPERVMRTDYVISDFQETYFVIDSIKGLFDDTAARDFTQIYNKLPAGFTYATTSCLDTDVVITEGTQEYKFCGGRGRPRAMAHMEKIRAEQGMD